jgi:RimJ/RimL family protein N-acetyltransferase
MKLLSDHLPSDGASTRLRRFQAGDLARFQAYRSDPELARFQGWCTMTEDDARGFVDEMAAVARLVPGDWVQLAIADAATDQLIGDVGLYLAADGCEAEVGFTLCREAQGQGHATAAAMLATRLLFECSKADRVRGVTDARNAASIRVLERAGFVKVGEQRAVFKGEACVEFVYVTHRAARRPSLHGRAGLSSPQVNHGAARTRRGRP